MVSCHLILYTPESAVYVLQNDGTSTLFHAHLTNMEKQLSSSLPSAIKWWYIIRKCNGMSRGSSKPDSMAIPEWTTWEGQHLKYTILQMGISWERISNCVAFDWLDCAYFLMAFIIYIYIYVCVCVYISNIQNMHIKHHRNLVSILI